jgi:hypothetical protein
MIVSKADITSELCAVIANALLEGLPECGAKYDMTVRAKNLIEHALTKEACNLSISAKTWGLE